MIHYNGPMSQGKAKNNFKLLIYELLSINHVHRNHFRLKAFV